MKKSSWFKISAVVGLAVLFSSCLKNNDDYKPGITSVSLINAYSGNPSVNFYYDGQQVNTQPLLYKQNTAYLRFYSGGHYIGVAKPGSNTYLINGGAALSPDKSYSFFVSKGTGTTEQDSITAGIVEDDLTAPASGKAKIRFANFVPSSTNQIDVYVEGVTDSLFGKKSFRTVSKFKEVDAGDKTFQLRQTGQAETKLSVPVTLEAGKIYTLTASGLWDGAPGTVNSFTAFTTNHSAAVPTNTVQ